MDIPHIDKFIQGSSTKIAVLSVIVVGVMVFLVPHLVEEAQAVITATAVSTVGPFADIWSHMVYGKFFIGPGHVGPVIAWGSEGGRYEGGVVQAKVIYDNPRNYALATFWFSNPPSGYDNSCTAGIMFNDNLKAACHIDPRGDNPSATFSVTRK